VGGAAGFFPGLSTIFQGFSGRAEPEGPGGDGGGKVEKWTDRDANGEVASWLVAEGSVRTVAARYVFGIKVAGSEVRARCAASVGWPCTEWRYGGRDVTMDSFRRGRNTRQVDRVESD
jgi:hypothetical protein